MLNLELLCNSVVLCLHLNFEKDFEVVVKIKYYSWKESGTHFKEEFVFRDNHVQIILE